MAHLIEGDFSTWELTEQEETEGMKFTIVQTQVLQNELSIFASEMLGLEYDANDPTRFIQQQADLSGKIKWLQYVLERSTSLQESTATADDIIAESGVEIRDIDIEI